MFKKDKLSEFNKIIYAARKSIGYAVKVSKKHTFLLFFTFLIVSILPFVIAWLNSLLIDEIVRLLDLPDTNLKPFYILLGYYIGTMLVRSITFSIYGNSLQNMWFDFSMEFNNELNRKYSELDMAHYDNPETRILLQKVYENAGDRPQGFLNGLILLIQPVVAILSSFSFIFLFSPTLVFVLFISVLPSAIVNIIFGKRRWGIWDMKGEPRRNYHYTRSYLQSDGSLMELRIFGIRSFFLEKTYAMYKEFQEEQRRIENKRIGFGFYAGVLSLLGFGYTYLNIAISVIYGVISLGQFSFYISIANRLQDAFDNFFKNVSSLYENGLYVYDIFKFLELENSIQPGIVKLDTKPTPPLIEFKNVSFIYPGTKDYVLKNFNLKVEPGLHLAIVGENGAGKTTLVKLLMRFYDVTDGEILIDSKNLKSLDLEDWYKRVGTLFQSFNIYHFDAKTSIGLGDISRMENQDEIINAAKKAGAHDFIEKYERGYEQVLNKSFENGISPSDGQRQRIALARVFFRRPKVLVLDEPTSAIDPKAEYEIFEDLFSSSKGTTMIIISHRFSTVKNAERIIVFDKGGIIEDGTHEQLMKIKDGKYKTAFELQKKGYE